MNDAAHELRSPLTGGARRARGGATPARSDGGVGRRGRRAGGPCGTAGGRPARARPPRRCRHAAAARAVDLDDLVRSEAFVPSPTARPG
ncbi:MAG: hypothetical protein R2713_21870 [Ilumatobacteraceae bacterium]